MVEENDNNVCLRIPFSSSEHASIAYEVLNVDRELRGSGVHREISKDGVNLVVKFEGVDLKKIRVAVNAFLRNVLLVVKTIEFFQFS